MKPDTSLGIGRSATTENNTGIEHDSRRRFQEKSVLLAKVELLHGHQNNTRTHSPQSSVVAKRTAKI